jgi:hypothetical protein
MCIEEVMVAMPKKGPVKKTYKIYGTGVVFKEKGESQSCAFPEATALGLAND